MDQENLTKIKPSYVRRYVTVKGFNMHYLEQGEGDPILFLHGVPTSSYVWRNVFPALSDVAHCIAPDLIGMGDSEKPDIDYRVFDHIDYIESFIDHLSLDKITLVMHGWGSVIGFAYAARHEEKIKAMAFFEAHLRSIRGGDTLSLPVQQILALMNRPGASYRAIVQQNYLVNKLLPLAMGHELDPEVMAIYQKAFPTPESRKPLWQYVRDLPFEHGPDDVMELIQHYSNWLQVTKIPKLLFYAIPGFMTTIDTVQWAKDHLPNVQLVALENVFHFPQETEPLVFRQKLREWYLSLLKTVI